MKKPRLLIYNHSQPGSERFLELLKEVGFEAVTPQEAEDTLECLADESIETLVMDISSENDEGWVLFQALLSRNRQLSDDPVAN